MLRSAGVKGLLSSVEFFKINQLQQLTHEIPEHLGIR